MQKRNTQQRRRTIIEQLNHRGELAVEELSKFFSTSEVTIRKDLAELEKNGLLLRRFGGAILLPSDSAGLTFDKLSKRKKAIGELAASLINDHNRIIVDGGTTTSALLPHLVTKPELVVMTNSLDIANSLLEKEKVPKVLMSGGTWDAHSHSFQGQMAEQVLRAYNFDQAFIGAAGLDPKQGSTTFNELTSLSRVMAEVSEQVIVMAESEKLNRKMPNIELPWSSISVLVTDTSIDQIAKQQIENYGVNVMCASETDSTSGD